jgi:hypothetical protein
MNARTEPALRALCAIAAVALLSAPVAARAQESIALRGLVDIVGHGQQGSEWLNTNNTADGNFDPLRARLFVDGRRENTQIFLQFLFSQQSMAPVRLWGGYLRHNVFGDERLTVEAGLVPMHVGVWAPHTYSNRNPLVGIPLVYFWKSNLPTRAMPNDLDDLLAHRGEGQQGITYADSNGVRGRNYPMAPLLYDNCWNYGAHVMGAMGNMRYTLGATLGPPAATLREPDVNDNIAVLGALGYALTPGLTVTVSGAYGAYLSRDVAPYLPAGKSVNDYYQSVIGGSAEWKWNHLSTMGEVMFNRFDTPLRADGLSNRSFWLQAVYTLFPQWEVAARYDELRYERVRDSAGNEMTWDVNVYRMEGGVLYRVSRDLRVKGVVQATDMGEGFTSDLVVPAVQISFAF